MRALPPLLLLSMLTGCAGSLDRVVKNRTIPELARSRDLWVACSFGELGAAASVTVSAERSEVALAVSYTMAGLCAELDARELALHSPLALANAPLEGRAAAATDARLAAARRHADAALRYQQGYEWALAAYGGAEDCKLRSENDAGVYLLGLMSGLLAQVQDAEADGAVGVPLNQLLEVARATECLDDEQWWGIPAAARNSAWATVPGSGPEGVDPWDGLRQAAARGDAVGQGIPRALWLFTAANAGRDELVREILEGWPAIDPARSPAWPLLDAYARVIARHEADRMWIAAAGHRAPEPPAPPSLESEGAADPFGGDDPFAPPPAEGPAPE